MSDSPSTSPAVIPLTGFLLDSARCQESRAYYCRFVDFVAARGARVVLWHFTDDQGCSLQFESVPGLASPNAYTKAELRELVRYAADRGVELVPELASLGHCRYLTRLPAFSHLAEDAADATFSGMSPLADETRRVIAGLLAEVAEVFDGPNVHVGLDEVNIGGHPLTRAALTTRSAGALLGDYAAFLRDTLAAMGKRIWMWGDGVLKHPDMLARVPRDVVICNWQYAPEVPAETTQTLLDAGFDVMLCSALISHDQTLFPGEHFALPNVRALDAHRSLVGRGRVLGHLVTIWTPVRFIADSLWLGVDLAAATLRGETGRDATIRAFASTFYGLVDGDADRFANVARLIADESPTRDEWMAIAKLASLPPAIAARAATLAPRWSRAAATLRELDAAVRDHATEFRAFALLINTLAHAYDAATAPTDLQALIARGSAIVERLECAWDRERFADDPRKVTAPIPSFQDDHLLPLIGSGLAALERRAADAARAADRGPTRRGDTIAAARRVGSGGGSDR